MPQVYKVGQSLSAQRKSDYGLGNKYAVLQNGEGEVRGVCLVILQSDHKSGMAKLTDNRKMY